MKNILFIRLERCRFFCISNFLIFDNKSLFYETIQTSRWRQRFPPTMQRGATTLMSSHYQTNWAAKIWLVLLERPWKYVHFSHITFHFLIRNVELMTYHEPIGGRLQIHLKDTTLLISQFLTIWVTKIWFIPFKRSFSGVYFPHMIFGI